MPPFDVRLSDATTVASDIVTAGEVALASRIPEWTVKRLEFLYELAYLRTFAAWESFLEAIFYRSLCGYASRAGGQETLVAGTYHRTVSDAERAVLGPRRQYVLWHNPADVAARCRHFIQHGRPGIQESVIASNITRLQHLAAIRHRVVHDQANARLNFDQATLALAGRTYPASRPGKFLRDTDRATAQKWLEVFIAELNGLAGQIV
jgi:hypothetical protein